MPAIRPRRKRQKVSILDTIEQSVADDIKEAGGSSNALGIWKKTWEELSKSCVVTPGPADEYTKDIVLCWSGWVLAADPDATDRIYAACKGFNLSFKEDETGYDACRAMYDGIDKHVSDPASVYRELARDQLERLRERDREEKLFGEKAEGILA